MPANHRAMLPMVAKANNGDEAKRYGKQDGGALNLREVPNMVVSPKVEQTKLGDQHSALIMCEHLSLLLRTQHLKEPTKGTDVERMTANGH